MKLSQWIVSVVCFAFVACNHVPQPCDPEFLASQQMITAVACKSNAEKTCPGYDRLAEDEKLACPGVKECLDKIEQAEKDCHGN